MHVYLYFVIFIKFSFYNQFMRTAQSGRPRPHEATKAQQTLFEIVGIH